MRLCASSDGAASVELALLILQKVVVAILIVFGHNREKERSWGTTSRKSSVFCAAAVPQYVLVAPAFARRVVSGRSGVWRPRSLQPPIGRAGRRCEMGYLEAWWR